jgi:hypothetical protein
MRVTVPATQPGLSGGISRWEMPEYARARLARTTLWPVLFFTEIGSYGSAYWGAGRDSGIGAQDCVARRSPWIFATVVVIELARLLWAESLDEPSHGSHALLRRQRRFGTAHISPDPSRVDQNTSDAERR